MVYPPSLFMKYNWADFLQKGLFEYEEYISLKSINDPNEG